MHSEKARIPAWTDRILRKGTNLRQIDYNSAPLRFSDHRPVYATFQCTVAIVDEAIREALSREIYETRRLEVGALTANPQVVDSDDEELIGYDSIEPGLPPASSDKRKWWLDNGKPARSDTKPLQPGAVPNPSRPSNPFTPSEEPDWVTVPRMLHNQTASQITPSFTPPPPNPRPATNGSRKLPPPFTPQSVASLANNFSQASLKDTPVSTPNQPSSGLTSSSERRASISSTSTTSKKSAPPVGRKPVHLTSSPTLSTSPKASLSKSPQPLSRKSPQSTGNSAVVPPPPRRSIAAVPLANPGNELRNTDLGRQTGSPPPPPQSRRSGVADGAGESGRGAYAADQGPKPGLPPRPIRDLLGTEDDELSGWEALKPS
jgi:hypothetical protein